MRKGRGTTSMRVIYHRSREASVIPIYIRVKATAKCYCSNVGKEKWGPSKGIPGMRKNLFRVQ